LTDRIQLCQIVRLEFVEQAIHAFIGRRNDVSHGFGQVERRPRLGKFQSPERLIEELKRLDNLGKTENLLQTARLLDVSYSCILKLAPEYAAQLVQRGRETRRKKKIEGEKARFNAYWQSFQEMCRENRWPTGRRVAMRLFQRTGKRSNSFEACTFHARAMRLAKLSTAKP